MHLNKNLNVIIITKKLCIKIKLLIYINYKYCDFMAMYANGFSVHEYKFLFRLGCENILYNKS